MELFQSFAFIYFVFSIQANEDVLTTDGEIIFGGLFHLHTIGPNERTCGSFSANPGYQYMEAMLYTVDNINKRQDILPGIKLGTIIYDTCKSPTISGDKTKELIKLTLSSPTANGSELAGVIGPGKSANSIIAANFLRVFRIPQISYASAAAELSNKDRYEYFFRTVPPSSFFAEALVGLLQRLEWTYVSIVYSTGTWSEAGAQEVIKVLLRKNMCIARRKKLDRFPKPKDYDDVVQDLVSDDDQPSVVVLVTVRRDSRRLLKAKKRNVRAFRLFFVSGIGWSNKPSIVKDLEEIAQATISFGHREGSLPHFKSYFETLRFNNYSRNNRKWIGEYWQETHRCNLLNFTVRSDYTKNCTGDEQNIFYKELAPVHVVKNAVQAMANALDDLQRHLCPKTVGICRKMRPLRRDLLLKFLRNVTFKDAVLHYPVKFNAKQEVDGNYTLYNFQRGNGIFSYVRVGSWVGRLNPNGSITGNLYLDRSKVRWTNGSRTIPLSSCKPNCRRNEVSLQRDDMCCWECFGCGNNDIVVNNTCQTCADGFVPDEALSSCLRLPLKYLNMDTPLSIVLAFLSCLGSLADLSVFVVFIANRHHQLIKASGREMCYVILFGIFVVFMIPFAFLAKPTKNLCYFRRFILGMSFTICYAPLLLKVWRIHRIFLASATQFRRLSAGGLLGRRCQLVTTLGLIAFQGLFCALTSITDPPTLGEIFYHEREELVLECNLKKSVFVILFAYNVILPLCCTIFAFLTRRFPKNFNEAMYIGITMYLTCVVWVAFFATFLNADYSIYRLYWISTSSVVISWVTLVGLFAPKLYQLYTKTEFKKEMLISWDESSIGKVETSIPVSGVCQSCKMRWAEDTKNTSIRSEVTLNDCNEVGSDNVGLSC